MKRLVWLDVAKGLSILTVVYFHFFTTYFEHGSLPPDDWSNLANSATTILGNVWLFVSGLGFHAVGAFIILSGWVLMQSTASRAASAPVAWGTWYRARLLRLYPMYWVAHLVYLLSPFVARFEQVDGRIVLSLLGLRFVDITMNFMYLNAAWWYFSMLIQLYLIFPLLFWTARKLGPWTFLLIACAVGFFARYLLLIVYPQDGLWLLGGFAICRLPEFALGMALGMWHSQSPARAERFLPQWRRIGDRIAALSRGATALPQRLHLYLCRSRHRRLLLSGNDRRRRNYFAFSTSGQSDRPRRRILLRFVSRASTLCHLARTSHPGATDLDVLAHRCGNDGRAQRVGNRFGKRDQRASQQVHPEEEKGVTFGSAVYAEALAEIAAAADTSKRDG